MLFGSYCTYPDTVNQSYEQQTTITTVPEPSTLIFMLVIILGIIVFTNNSKKLRNQLRKEIEEDNYNQRTTNPTKKFYAKIKIKKGDQI
jgi:hypothetical protein